MTVYVDPLFQHPKSRGHWCHMAVGVDDSIEELHHMAQQIGLKRSWFQDHPLHPHYDLRPSKRELAVRNGAVELSPHDFVKTCSKLFNQEKSTDAT